MFDKLKKLGIVKILWILAFASLALLFFPIWWVFALPVLIFLIVKKNQKNKKRNIRICSGVFITSFLWAACTSTPTELTELSINWEKTQFVVNETIEIDLDTYPEGALIEVLELSDNNIAELEYVDGKALVTFKQAGEAILYFTANQSVKTESESITVVEQNSNHESIPNPTIAPSQQPTETPTTTSEPTQQPTETPTTTSEPTQESTVTPTGSITSEPTQELTATPTPKPTATATPTQTPTATATPKPTQEPTATPTQTPTVTATPKPTQEPTATPTQTPTATPKPTTTSKPTQKPTATPTPEPTQELLPEADGDEKIIVYITETGEKYHRGTCRYLRKSKIETNLQKAKRWNYTPCSVCKPPT